MKWREFHEKLKEALRNRQRLNLDEIAGIIAGLGIPALVLIVLIAVSSWFGAAAITSSLAILGGPLGMIGGVVALTALALIAQASTKYGCEILFRTVLVKIMEKENKTKEEIEEIINGYPISDKIKRKIKEHIRKSCDCDNCSEA